MSPESFLRFVAFFLISLTWPIRAICPENLEDGVDVCVRKQTPLKNRSSFIGVDMERLRIMCGEFYSTMHCLTGLVKDCPEHTSRFIEARLNTLEHQPHKELMHKLCSEKDLYEKYSLHFNCFSRRRKRLHQCFHVFEKSMEPFVRSHVMTSQVCGPVNSLLTCTDEVLAKCPSGAADLMRVFVGPLMPQGVGVDACPAIAGQVVEEKATEKASPEHYKVLYKGNVASSLNASSSWAFVFFSCLIHIFGRGRD